jgi:hypothetical protein
MVTYRELGERLGIDVCTDCARDTNHQAGSWSTDGRLHWSERALRRTSIRNFVWRASAQWARLDDVEVLPRETWLRYWSRVQWAKRVLRELHVRLPASAWDQQRATLRALLAVPAGAGTFFDDVFAEQRGAARKAALRWAKKPVDQGDPGE